MRLHNRQVKADFWSDGELLRWPLAKRVFYQGLWHLADDSGCVEDDPFTFKLILFPSPVDCDITVELLTQYCAEMVEAGKLIRYEANGRGCFFVKNFHTHQRLRNPGAPSVPLPDWIVFTEDDNPRRGGQYAVSIPEEKVREGKVRDTVTSPSQYQHSTVKEEPATLVPAPPKARLTRAQYTPRFDEWWKPWVTLGRDDDKPGTFKRYAAWVKSVGEDALFTARDAYLSDCRNKGTEPRYIKHAHNFLDLKACHVEQWLARASSPPASASTGFDEMPDYAIPASLMQGVQG